MRISMDTQFLVGLVCASRLPSKIGNGLCLLAFVRVFTIQTMKTLRGSQFELVTRISLLILLTYARSDLICLIFCGQQGQSL